MSKRRTNTTSATTSRVTTEDVLDAFDAFDAPAVTAQMLANHLDERRPTVFRRLERLKRDGQVDQLAVGARAIIWWPTDGCPDA